MLNEKSAFLSAKLKKIKTEIQDEILRLKEEQDELKKELIEYPDTTILCIESMANTVRTIKLEAIKHGLELIIRALISFKR